MADTAPLTRKLEATVPAVAAASDGDQTIGEVPFTGEVTGASYTPEANITGNTTETRTLTIVNKGTDGNGTTVIGTLAFTTGINGLDFDEKAFTLSATAADLDVSEGQILAFVSTHGGSTGLADPGGKVQVEISRGQS